MTPENAARLSASEVACYRWPEDTAEHRDMRAAFCDGAAHTIGAPAQTQQEPVAWQKRPNFGDIRTWTSCNAEDQEFWREQDYEMRPLYSIPAQQTPCKGCPHPDFCREQNGCQVEECLAPAQTQPSPVVEDARHEVANWMIGEGYVTGHGNTLNDLMQELVTQAQQALTSTDGNHER